MNEPEIVAYAIPGPAGSSIRVERVAGGWAVLSGPWRIGRDCEAAWEPIPSERTPEWRWVRYDIPSLEEALTVARGVARSLAGEAGPT